MSKTAETILGKVLDDANHHLDTHDYHPVIRAMHTYAQQQSEEFAEWVAPYNYYGKGIWVGFDDVQYTTSDLYKLYLTQQNNK